MLPVYNPIIFRHENLREIFSAINSSHFCDSLFFPCSFLTRAKRWNKFWICKGVNRRTCKAERTSDSDMGCASDIMLVSSSAHDSLHRAIPWSFKKLRLPIIPHITPAHKWWLLYLNQSWCQSTLQIWIKTEVPFLYCGDLLDKWSCWGIAKCTTFSSGIHVLHKILNFSISTVVCMSGWRFIHSSNIVSNFEYNN